MLYHKHATEIAKTVERMRSTLHTFQRIALSLCSILSDARHIPIHLFSAKLFVRLKNHKFLATALPCVERFYILKFSIFRGYAANVLESWMRLPSSPQKHTIFNRIMDISLTTITASASWIIPNDKVKEVKFNGPTHRMTETATCWIQFFQLRWRAICFSTSGFFP